jgi:DNA-directed RNA polymerase sigma subunit (sigma70/sigma32)
VTKARGRLESLLGRRPSINELAVELGLDEKKVSEILRYVGEPLSLSEPLGGGDAELGDLVEDHSAVSPFDAAAASILPSEVAKMLVALDERERGILRLRYGLDGGPPRTLDQVGRQFGLTRERIRQIEARAMSKLRHPSTDRGAALTGACRTWW